MLLNRIKTGAIGIPSNHKAPTGDSTVRTLAKTVSWRVIGTLDTVLISWLITGTLKLAFSIGIIELVTKMVLYFFHERTWNYISFGR